MKHAKHLVEKVDETMLKNDDHAVRVSLPPVSGSRFRLRGVCKIEEYVKEEYVKEEYAKCENRNVYVTPKHDCTTTGLR